MLVIELNPFSHEFHNDPYPIYKKLRDEDPLYGNEKLGFWALSRHADVNAALKDYTTFSNHDEREFANPDIYDIERDSRSITLSFGQGLHFCVGAGLARLEGRVCLEEMLKHFDSWQIHCDQLVRIHNGNVRGFLNMPMSYSVKT